MFRQSTIETPLIRWLIASCSALLFAFLNFAHAADVPAKPAAKHRVIFQVSDNDPGKWNLALNNARNMQQDLGERNVEIEIGGQKIDKHYGDWLQIGRAHV